jgi:sirohydrochlorin cobaltochelatase
MNHDEFGDAVLVVLGHGTERNADSAAPVHQHAAELRRRKLFAEVREAFWKQEPQIKDVLTGLSARRVFIAPLFVSEGYFASKVIPHELGFSGNLSTLKPQRSMLYYCKPVGSHDSMTGVILARARDIVEQFPFPRAPKAVEITLFIAGHGTEKNENSRQPMDRQVALIREMNLYGGVHAIFLEENPRIPECYGLARTKNLVVVPFFISDGLHTQEDIPVLLGETRTAVQHRLALGQPVWRNPMEKHGKLVWYTPAIGSEPHLADVILERVKEAAGAEGTASPVP